MSCVYVSVGQCGNQVLSAFLDEASNCANQTVCNYSDQYRAVCIDTEEKVVSALNRTANSKKVPRQNVIHGRRGRGSNWAYGFNGSKDEFNLVEDSLQLIRKEIERCDVCQGVALFHSLAGGTGSGLGSRLVVELRDELALHHLLNCVVAPHATGESPLQAYNQVLTLACLARHSDGVLFFSNDQLLRHLGEENGTSLAAMNSLLSKQLVSLLTPSRSLYAAAMDLLPSGISGLATIINLEPWELLRSLCALPQCKFLAVTSSHKASEKPVKKAPGSVPGPPPDWNQLSRDLARNYRHSLFNISDDAVLTQEPHCISAVCSVRGDRHDTFARDAIVKLNGSLQRLLRPVDWNPFWLDFWLDNKSQFGPSYTMALNDAQFVKGQIAPVIIKAKRKFQAGAYLHWFSRHGCVESDFLDAFEQCDTVVKDYDAMVAPSADYR